MPEVSSNDDVDNQDERIRLFRDGEPFNVVKRINKADYPAIQAYFKSRQKQRTSNPLLEKFTRSDSASEFTELIVIMLKKGIWSLPLSQQTPPWNL